jgi:GAF domain-containing protein
VARFPKPAPLPEIAVTAPADTLAAAAPVAPPAGVTIFELLRRRSEEPTPRAPITYREEAYVVAAGTQRNAVEALLRERLGVVQTELSSGPPGKLVQLAIFDHSFSDKPVRPPLGTLAWKDWRGDPVLGFPAFGDSAPPLSSRIPPAPTARPAEHVNGARRSEPPTTSLLSAPAPAPAPAAAAAQVPTAAPADAQATSVAAPPAEAQASSVAAPSAEAQASSVAAPPTEAHATPAPATASSPSGTRASRPRLIVPRRRAGEDLISELFEIMHELHFARDIATGAEFVAGVLSDVIPSDVLLIQVFDINTRKFVVVRARGVGSDKALLHSTPDNDPKIVEIMRRDQVRAFRPNGEDNFKAGRWGYIQDEISEVLVGPVRQGGRYLGLIELANPLGGDPFHQTEINALDYICSQFADFVASRPIVLDADVILGR